MSLASLGLHKCLFWQAGRIFAFNNESGSGSYLMCKYSILPTLWWPRLSTVFFQTQSTKAPWLQPSSLLWFKYKFIYFNWRLITLQHCIGFVYFEFLIHGDTCLISEPRNIFLVFFSLCGGSKEYMTKQKFTALFLLKNPTIESHFFF